MSDPLSPNLAPHKGLRGEILLTLKHEQPLAAKELAARLSVSPNAIRHHLKELEAEGLIGYGREQRGVGAPTLLYRLSPGGESLFPKRYETILARLLNHIIETEGRGAALQVVEQEYETLARKLEPVLEGLSEPQRVQEVAQALREAGYMTECEGQDGEYRIIEHNCAIRAVAERLPEVCDAEARFLSRVLPAEVERRDHMLAGCNTCQFAITICHHGGRAA